MGFLAPVGIGLVLVAVCWCCSSSADAAVLASTAVLRRRLPAFTPGRGALPVRREVPVVLLLAFVAARHDMPVAFSTSSALLVVRRLEFLSSFAGCLHRNARAKHAHWSAGEIGRSDGISGIHDGQCRSRSRQR